MNSMSIITIQTQENIAFKNNIFIFEGQNTNKAFKLNVLRKCSVITTELGPVEDDFALALFFGNEALIVPSEHKAYKALYEALSVLLQLDYKAYINAMSCTENAEFLLWEAPEDIIRLIPIDKFDTSVINELKSIEVSRVIPILPDLLEWIQDLNWPVARELIEILPRFHAELVLHIVDVFQSDDDIWKCWTLDLIKKFPVESIKILMPEIKRMVEFPSGHEMLEGVTEKAQEFIVAFQS